MAEEMKMTGEIGEGTKGRKLQIFGSHWAWRNLDDVPQD